MCITRPCQQWNALQQSLLLIMTIHIYLVKCVTQFLSNRPLHNNEHSSKALESPGDEILEQLTYAHAALRIEMLHHLIEHEQVAYPEIPSPRA